MVTEMLQGEILVEGLKIQTEITSYLCIHFFIHKKKKKKKCTKHL
jgi:hypothetical protein